MYPNRSKSIKGKHEGLYYKHGAHNVPFSIRRLEKSLGGQGEAQHWKSTLCLRVLKCSDKDPNDSSWTKSMGYIKANLTPRSMIPQSKVIWIEIQPKVLQTLIRRHRLGFYISQLPKVKNWFKGSNRSSEGVFQSFQSNQDHLDSGPNKEHLKSN